MHSIDSSGRSQAAVLRKDSTLLLVIGWACAVLSLFFYPFIFGVIGVISGIFASKRGGRAGVTLIVASMILICIGLIFSPFLLNRIRLYLGI